MNIQNSYIKQCILTTTFVLSIGFIYSPSVKAASRANATYVNHHYHTTNAHRHTTVRATRHPVAKASIVKKHSSKY